MSIEDVRKFLRERGLEAVPVAPPPGGTFADYMSWLPENTQPVRFLGGNFPNGITTIDATGHESEGVTFSDAFVACTTVILDGSFPKNVIIPASTIILSIQYRQSGTAFVCTLPAGLQQLLATGASVIELPPLNNGLLILDLTNCVSLLEFPVLPATLTTLRMGATPYDVPTLPALTTELECADCGWTDAQVNNLLAQLVANGGSNGTVTADGSNDAPSGQGIIDKNTLTTRGWTVTTN